MKKLYFFALLVTASITSAFAQQEKIMEPNRDNRFQYINSVQLELGGHGIIYSVNYERNLLNFNYFKTSIQVGISFYPSPVDLRSRLWVPITFNQLFSLKNHHLELGFGMVITEYQNYSVGDELYYTRDIQPFIAAKAGYRYQKPGGRMQYKLLFTPIWDKGNGSVDFKPLGAFSIGYAFGK